MYNINARIDQKFNRKNYTKTLCNANKLKLPILDFYEIQLP